MQHQMRRNVQVLHGNPKYKFSYHMDCFIFCPRPGDDPVYRPTARLAKSNSPIHFPIDMLFLPNKWNVVVGYN
jgi:hypothetical protein